VDPVRKFVKKRKKENEITHGMADSLLQIKLTRRLRMTRFTCAAILWGCSQRQLGVLWTRSSLCGLPAVCTAILTTRTIGRGRTLTRRSSQEVLVLSVCDRHLVVMGETTFVLWMSYCGYATFRNMGNVEWIELLHRTRTHRHSQFTVHIHSMNDDAGSENG
jgi:hypothetical protein